MEADMASAWQTLEEAALTLGISSRTLHRRIAKGEFQTRLESGRREVLVTVFAPEVAVEVESSDASDSASAATDINEQGVHNTMLMLHEDRLRRTDLAIMAYQQSVNVSSATARRATVNSRIAWGTAGGLVCILFIGITWATHRVTRVEAQVEHLNGQVRQLSDTADTKTREAEKLRVDAESARLAAARVEGELSGTKVQLNQLAEQANQLRSQLTTVSQPVESHPPTTQPFSFVDSLVPIIR
jgi:hypothetical protein